MKVKWLLGRFEIVKVVSIVDVFGVEVICNLVVIMVCFNLNFGLVISGVFVLDI